MVRKVVEIQNCIDPNANLHQRLRRRRKIHQQYFLLARGVPGFWRRSGGQCILVFMRGQQAQIFVSQSVQLGTRRKYLVEARHVAVKHQVEITLNGVKQGIAGGTVRHLELAWFGADAIDRDTGYRGMSLQIAPILTNK